MNDAKPVTSMAILGMLILWSGCGSSGGGGGPTATPVVTSITISGVSSEPSVVTGTAAADRGATVGLTDADPRPSAWSLTFSPGVGDTAVTVHAVDGAGNEREYTANVSLP